MGNNITSSNNTNMGPIGSSVSSTPACGCGAGNGFGNLFTNTTMTCECGAPFDDANGWGKCGKCHSDEENK